MADPRDIPLNDLAALMVDGTPYAAALGMRAVSLSDAEAVAALPFREDLVGDPGLGAIHGGAATALLDQVCGMAAFAAMRDLGAPVTLDLRVDYLRRPTPGAGLIATAKVTAFTRSVAFLDAAARHPEEDEPVAAARATFVVPQRPSHAPRSRTTR